MSLRKFWQVTTPQTRQACAEVATYPKQKSRFSREALNMVDKEFYLAL